MDDNEVYEEEWCDFGEYGKDKKSKAMEGLSARVEPVILDLYEHVRPVRAAQRRYPPEKCGRKTDGPIGSAHSPRLINYGPLQWPQDRLDICIGYLGNCSGPVGYLNSPP